MTDRDVAQDPILARALLAVGRTRALGLHFYGHFVGIGGGEAVDGNSRLTVEGEPEGFGASGVSAVALATVADLSIGGAIRSHLERGSRLATATLTVQHPQAAVVGPVTARGEAEDQPVEQRAGRCLLEGPDSQPIGYAQGWFAALPPPPGWVQRPMPWEHDELPPINVPTLEELTADEAGAVKAAQVAAERARVRGTSVSEELLHFKWQPAVEDRSVGELTNGPELANRVGHIQGGAMYGAAAIVAAQALGVPLSSLVEGQYQFMRPADAPNMRGEGTVLRRGRLAGFAEARLSMNGKLVGIGLFSFRG
jgi:acyl-coenzyme A thioesterase PaaI-like protein